MFFGINACLRNDDNAGAEAKSPELEQQVRVGADYYAVVNLEISFADAILEQYYASVRVALSRCPKQAVNVRSGAVNRLSPKNSLAVGRFRGLDEIAAANPARTGRPGKRPVYK